MANRTGMGMGMSNAMTQKMGPKEFNYAHDFDENGALFFLGT